MNVYEIVTEKILTELDRGTIPWRKSWATLGNAAPANMVTKKAYRGINVWLLAGSKYASPFYGTYNQAKAAGGNVNKGEKSSLVVFYSRYTKAAKDEDEQPKETWILRYYNVFNIEQMTLPEQVRNRLQPAARTIPPIEAAEQIIRGLAKPPGLRFGFDQAAYAPGLDEIRMPNRGQFGRLEDFYATLFHEQVHATGHKSRLDRPGISEQAATFGSDLYSKEELIAELGAAFLCGVVGIEQTTIPNHAAYIKNWSDNLRQDSRLIVRSASAAQKAADYMLGTAAAAEDEETELAVAA